jgi:hypothetical protein
VRGVNSVFLVQLRKILVADFWRAGLMSRVVADASLGCLWGGGFVEEKV